MTAAIDDALTEYLAIIIRIAYAEGFRAGAQWLPDTYNGVAQGAAFDYEAKHRESTEEAIAAILKGPPAQ